MIPLLLIITNNLITIFGFPVLIDSKVFIATDTSVCTDKTVFIRNQAHTVWKVHNVCLVLPNSTDTYITRAYNINTLSLKGSFFAHRGFRVTSIKETHINQSALFNFYKYTCDRMYHKKLVTGETQDCQDYKTGNFNSSLEMPINDNLEASSVFSGGIGSPVVNTKGELLGIVNFNLGISLLRPLIK